MIIEIPQTSSTPMAPQQTNDSQRLKKACSDFESIFINQMLKASDTGISGEGGFLNGNDGKIIKSMFNEKLAGTMSSGGGIGLGEILFEKLKA
ncbi:rod-binding protein [Desulfocicer niacini]